MSISRIDVAIPTEGALVDGTLMVPSNPRGVVIFAHGSGSSRFSPRNAYVADVLQKESIATLQIDLLTDQEDANPEARFDIALLSTRLMDITRWVASQALTRHLPIGYFGASTGAAAALKAAARLGDIIDVIVSRGGRPDLAGDECLESVVAPTLLMVGGKDDVVITLNRAAIEKLHCEKQILIVPGATHLFEEPGALEQVARFSADWFVRRF
ncbi:MAG: alpha/beta hydrolase [Oxalobacter sp.]|nr:MAG: alpha/beta hydrolase [Oxalobacter sp.]